MRAVVVSEPEPDGDTAATTPADRLELVERERPTPGDEAVLIEVDAEDTFALGVEGALDPVVERFSLADAAAAYRRTAENRTRFRAVLEP